jgi:cytochrome c-type biogenesis protein CcmE
MMDVHRKRYVTSDKRMVVLIILLFIKKMVSILILYQQLKKSRVYFYLPESYLFRIHHKQNLLYQNVQQQQLNVIQNLVLQ